MLLSDLTTSPLTLTLLGLCAGLILTLTILLAGQRRRYRTLRASPTSDSAAVVRVDYAGWHPDRRADLEGKLATLTKEHAQLQEAHTVLLARHKVLIREFQRMQQEATTRPRPAATLRKMNVQSKTG